MEKNIIYHGSNVEVSVPRILQNGFYKVLDTVFTAQAMKNRRSGGH